MIVEEVDAPALEGPFGVIEVEVGPAFDEEWDEYLQTFEDLLHSEIGEVTLPDLVGARVEIVGGNALAGRLESGDARLGLEGGVELEGALKGGGWQPLLKSLLQVDRSGLTNRGITALPLGVVVRPEVVGCEAEMDAESLVAKDRLCFSKNGIGELRMERGDGLGCTVTGLYEGNGDSFVGVAGP